VSSLSHRSALLIGIEHYGDDRFTRLPERGLRARHVVNRIEQDEIVDHPVVTDGCHFDTSFVHSSSLTAS